MREKEFIKAMNEVIELKKRQKYKDIITKSEEIKRNFPERARKPFLWQAAAYANLGSIDKSLDVLIAGADEGEWWNPESLLRIEELKVLHHRKEFKRLLELGNEKVESHKSSYEPFLKVHKGNKESPSILAYHWRGSTAEDFSEYWLDHPNITYGFAQSSQLYEKNSFCWDDEDRTAIDCQTIQHDFNPYQNGPLILAGASQGGMIALKQVLNNEMDAVGFILFAPAVKDLDAITPYLP